eukprot:CAMPEP_0201283274 /NCGR_PEP_ID=MMETSP1317-20130820/8126_1 /ASSEMBLY_ACC=CAM_ASM_000770 /TAXON_ID=187299 /ORGANISM="Undescribed Undescribed, Strain Undescribed" /LENGTH=52 /DNA_ID=CAMNT_0047598969 /DNA_START=45 /DNA_END=203 /DNA_ORIENTATION=-
MTKTTMEFYDNGDLSIPKENGRNPDPDGDNTNMAPIFDPSEVHEQTSMSFIM